MFLSLALLMVTYQMHDFVAMGLKELALHAQETGGKMIVDAVTGRAGFLMCICRCRQPLPATLVEYRAALRTDGGFVQLAFCLVGVVYTLLKEVVVPGDSAKT